MQFLKNNREMSFLKSVITLPSALRQRLWKECWNKQALLPSYPLSQHVLDGQEDKHWDTGKAFT